VNARRISIDIDELVLVGIDPGDRGAVAAAVERELARRLSATELPAAFGSTTEISLIDAGELTAPSGASPAVLGTSIAQSVHQGIAP
jgi:hypothetical protein